MIELKDINFVYGQRTPNENWALKNINLTIEKGEFLAIIGQTGSGKSTLIQLINGLEKPTSGDVYYSGQSIYDTDFDLQLLRRKIGFVFQYPEDQLFELEILADVCFAPINFGFSKEEAIIRAKQALSLVGIEERYHYLSPFEISGGQKRRVAIAGVLAATPEFLILDEPTSGLDPQGKKEILTLIRNLHKEKNITVILVTHNMEDAADYANRIIVMDKGSILFDDKPKIVFSKYKEIQSIGLNVPKVTYLMRQLKQRGLHVDDTSITIEEAKNAILKSLGEMNE